MPERTAVVASASDLHPRPATLSAKPTAELDVEVTIARVGTSADEAIDTSSTMSHITLGAGNGDNVVLNAEGPGAKEALDKLATLVETDLDAV